MGAHSDYGFYTDGVIVGSYDAGETVWTRQGKARLGTRLASSGRPSGLPSVSAVGAAKSSRLQSRGMGVAATTTPTAYSAPSSSGLPSWVVPAAVGLGIAVIVTRVL